MKRDLFIFAILVVNFGCKLNTNTASGFKHQFGVAQREDAIVVACTWDKNLSQSPEIDRYLAKIVLKIAQNNPKTFVYRFDPRKICIYLDLNNKVNALAKIEENKIVVNSGLLSLTSTDAQVARVLSHELAHLTMGSTHTKNVPPKVLLDPKWPQVRERFELVQKEVNELTASLTAESTANDKEISEVKKMLVQSASQQLRDKLCNLYYAHLFPRALLGIGDDTSVVSKADVLTMKISSVDIPVSDTCQAELENRAPVLTTPAIPKAVNDKQRITYRQMAQDRANSFLAAVKLSLDELSNRSPKIYARLTALKNNQRNISTKFLELLEPMQNKYKSQINEFNQFIATTTGDKEIGFNWIEQEADEVGYEFFLKATFKPQEYIWLSKNFMTPEDYQKCIDHYIKTEIAPPRGQETHPENCWRIYDILVLEANFHKTEYAPLIALAKTDTLYPGELEQVKSRIKNLSAKPPAK